MDENNVVANPVPETPSAPGPKTAGGHKYLILAIMVLVVGAVIIGAIFLIAFPKQTETGLDNTIPQTKQVSDVTKTTDLDTASSELNSTDLDSYQTDLNQIDSISSTF